MRIWRSQIKSWWKELKRWRWTLKQNKRRIKRQYRTTSSSKKDLGVHVKIIKSGKIIKNSKVKIRICKTTFGSQRITISFSTHSTWNKKKKRKRQFKPEKVLQKMSWKEHQLGLQNYRFKLFRNHSKTKSNIKVIRKVWMWKKDGSFILVTNSF